MNEYAVSVQADINSKAHEERVWNLARKAHDLLCENGGFSLDVNGNSPEPIGYAVAIEGNEEIYLTVTIQTLYAYFLAHWDVVASDPTKVFGAWFDNDRTYLDCTEIIDSLSEALWQGSERNQLSIYDLFEENVIWI